MSPLHNQITNSVLRPFDCTASPQNLNGHAAILALQKLANSGSYDALIALGAVIRGETYHFEIVSNESARGIMLVQLDSGVPIANGILTTENDAQALARMSEKGAACAGVAVEMAQLLRKLKKK